MVLIFSCLKKYSTLIKCTLQPDSLFSDTNVNKTLLQDWNWHVDTESVIKKSTLFSLMSLLITQTSLNPSNLHNSTTSKTDLWYTSYNKWSVMLNQEMSKYYDNYILSRNSLSSVQLMPPYLQIHLNSIISIILHFNQPNLY